jgi:murein DD-endopeptidase MepM/ murein hydrolase activator NlpD
MTAPQNSAHSNSSRSESRQPNGSQAKSNDSPSRSSLGQKIQRCSFATLGLLGSFGFVVSQMSFARAEGDFLVDDYATTGSPDNIQGSASDLTGLEGVSESSYTVSETTFPVPEPTFAVPEPTFEITQAPDPFLETAISTTPEPAAETFTVEAAPAYEPPAAPHLADAEAIAPAPAYVPPVPVAPQPSIAAATTVVASPTAPATAAPSITIEIEPFQTVAQPRTVPAQAATVRRVQPPQAVQPNVTPVSPPVFASAKKPDAKVAARSNPASNNIARSNPTRSNPLVGLIEAGSIAGPLANRVGSAISGGFSAATQHGSAAMSNLANLTIGQAMASQGIELASQRGNNRNSATLVAMGDTSAEGAAPVPEILPEPAAAPPVVDTAPVIEEPVAPVGLEPIPAPEQPSAPMVDTTDYSVGATAPDITVLEQSSGCGFTMSGGQGVPSSVCPEVDASDYLSAAEAEAIAQQNAQQAPVAADASGDGYYEEAPVAYGSAPAVNVGPVSFSAEGIRFQTSTTPAGRDYLNRSVRPLVNLQASEQFIFPLAIPAPITSLFGFRIHPISGDYRFHAGTDLGAAEGTPVLAVQDGVVTSADYSGGYGLMVVLEHDLKETDLQSRYAHLSDILVEPGKTVRKGEVIGLVGSTGNSTGPHLHFEMLQNTEDGWVLVNADTLVQDSLTKLVQALNNPMSVANFSLADLNLNLTRSLNGMRTTTAPSTRAGQSPTLPTLPGQNGVPFRPSQPNAS